MMNEHEDKCKESVSLLEITGQIVSAYAGKNPLDSNGLKNMIQDVYVALSQLEKGGHKRTASQPPVSIEDSVTPDYIICLEDGKKLKMLKRHLRTAYGLTPERYRERWKLPVDYPMVAPNYAERRSRLAKENGLGQGGRSRVYTHPAARAS